MCSVLSSCCLCLTCITLGSMGLHSPVCIKDKKENVSKKKKKSLELDENHFSKEKKEQSLIVYWLKLDFMKIL